MKVIVVGGFSEVFELCEECGLAISGYIDRTKLIGYERYEYLGDDDGFIQRELPSKKSFDFIISPDAPIVRKRLTEKYKEIARDFPLVVSTYAKVSKTAIIGQGTILQWSAHVSSDVTIGSFVKVNVLSNIMHDSKIGDYTTIAPNAAIMGKVTIGSGCYIGANSTIIQKISICDNVIIGAGAVVIRDICEPGTYIGIPAKKV